MNGSKLRRRIQNLNTQQDERRRCCFQKTMNKLVILYTQKSFTTKNISDEICMRQEAHQCQQQILDSGELII